MSNAPPLLTKPRAAQALGISIATLDRLHRKGLGPKRLSLAARRVGYRLDDLTAWLDERARPATAKEVQA